MNYCDCCQEYGDKVCEDYDGDHYAIVKNKRGLPEIVNNKDFNQHYINEYATHRGKIKSINYGWDYLT